MGGEHQCHKAKEFGELEAVVAILKDKVMGNGKDGLDVQVPLLSQNVEQLNEILPDLKTAMSASVQFQDGIKTEEKRKNRIKDRNRWFITTLLAILALLSGYIIAINFSG